jgi:hypothetical protein
MISGIGKPPSDTASVGDEISPAYRYGAAPAVLGDAIRCDSSIMGNLPFPANGRLYKE